MVKDCNYKDNEDMIRDRIVFGIVSQKIREKLINMGENLTLSKAIQICQSFEYAQAQLREMQAPSQGAAVNVVRSRRVTGHNTSGQPGHNSSGQWEQRRQQRVTLGEDVTRTCQNCGRKHQQQHQCPAKGKQCHKCQKWNHFASVCRSVNEVIDNNNSCTHDFKDLVIDNVESTVRNGQVFAEFKVGPSNLSVQFKIDTGSQVNILPYKTFRDIGIKSVLEASHSKLSAYDGSTLNVKGCITLRCNHPGTGQTKDVYFHVVDTHSSPLLSLQSSLDFELINLTYTVMSDSQVNPLTKDMVLKEYKEVFDGIGLLAGECKIHIDPTVQPVVHPPRKVPIALQEKVKDELLRMESLGVIEKVNEPTDWVSSMVVAEKANGKIRICLDPRDLNKAIQRPHYPLRTLDDILPQLSGAKYFTKLDARSGYWALKLERESSFLTCFNTLYGRYRYVRVPFGLKSSGDLFVQKIDACLEGLSGVAVIVDDILVYGSSREEHDSNLRAVLKRSHDEGIRFNETKLEVGVSEVDYFGHLLTSDGLKKSTSKTEAIQKMKPPKNKSELETILGMVNYLSRFAPNLADVTAPLRQLLSKEVEFCWETAQSDAFDKMKQIITDPNQVLSYYDKSKPLTLQVDASKFGLGATIMQDGKPLAYASKSLTQTEVNYAQIEKEMFAILFGCKRFHHFVYGHKVNVQTDHLPLVSIFKKSINTAPARLQRMLLQLQKYDLDIKHYPSKQVPVADTLSRNFLNETFPELSQGMDMQVHMVMSHLPVSDRKLNELKDKTSQDETLVLLKQTILQGWPTSRKMCPSQILPFWNFRDELTSIDGLVMKGNKIIIPISMQSQMLELIHTGHMGVEKCLRRARDVMFWPGISADITNLVLKCNTCLKHRNSNPKEPLIPLEIPDYPWQIIGTDLFTWENRNYLLIVDYYSRYFEVKELPNMKSTTVINRMKGIMARWGISEKVISDGGPCYISQEFADFAKEWDFNHQTISPYHSQSNGLAEKYVSVCKKLLTKAKDAGRDPFIGILEYRTTPLESGYSPAQLNMGRQLRSILPTSKENLMPKVISPNLVRQGIQDSKQKGKKYYDRQARSLEPLTYGENTMIQQLNKTWRPATVVDKLNERSYTVQCPDGSMYTRNRRDLLKTNEPCHGQFAEPEIQEMPLGQTPTQTDIKDSESPLIGSTSSPCINHNLYVTRSGRAVKPKVIESM
ncbi:uncharacterized protein K02A2.6-like [Mya arenaria]|uniref:uncharacterized protein K02A2.6-like n=1 Tax=Mya arenaria TaxID=6604 RepID=UPI0022E55DE6|nr:uncharacterized protein K02A2.6-like [Mya arenaria]